MNSKLTGDGDAKVKKKVVQHVPRSKLDNLKTLKKCLNVRQKLGTRSLSHSLTDQLLFSCLCSKVTLSHYLTLTLYQCLTLTLSLSDLLTLHMLNNFCFHVYAQKSLSLTLSHSHTLSISHLLTLDMLNNFCFHLYAQK
jgi:hypothetical protein